jgi:hypothetical protein
VPVTLARLQSTGPIHHWTTSSIISHVSRARISLQNLSPRMGATLCDKLQQHSERNDHTVSLAKKTAFGAPLLICVFWSTAARRAKYMGRASRARYDLDSLQPRSHRERARLPPRYRACLCACLLFCCALKWRRSRGRIRGRYLSHFAGMPTFLDALGALSSPVPAPSLLPRTSAKVRFTSPKP